MKSTFKFALSIYLSYVIGTVLAGFVFITLGGFLDEKLAFLNVVLGVVLVYIAMALPYIYAWRQGFKDRNYARYGHIKKDMARGLKAGLIAVIPLFAAAVLYIVAVFLNPEAVTSEGFEQYAFFYVVNIMSRLCFIPYIGIVNNYIAYSPFLLLPLLIPQPVAAMAGYMLGYRDFAILDRLMFKKRPAEDKK